MNRTSIGDPIQSAARGRPSARAFAAAMAMLTGMVLFLVAATTTHAAQRPPGCTGSGLGILLFTDAGDVHIGDTLRYSVTVLNGTGTGPLVCDASEIQAFVVTPDGASHPVALRRTELHSGESDYYPDVVSYVVRAQDLQADGTVRATATDTGVIHQNDTNSQGGANQGVNTEIKQPCLRIEATCVGGVGENGLITFAGTVRNCGNIALVGITVTNTVDGRPIGVVVIPRLTPGQSAPFNGGWIPLNPCAPATAALTARATDDVLSPVVVTSSVNVTCSNVLNPGIKIAKFCPVTPVSPGQSFVFSGSVSNSGNVTLTNIVVLNSRPAGGTPVFTLATLAPGTSATFTGSYLAPTNCSVADTLDVRASSLCGSPVADSATATCPILTTPRIAVTAACPTTPVLPGGTLVYTGTVRNTGDVTLNNIVVVSDRPGANTRIFTVATLAPGASANFSATLTAPAAACAIPTTVGASATDACTAVPASDSATFTCHVVTAPALAVVLACPATISAGGGPITYTGTVRNSGNVALIDVVVRGDLALPNPVVLNLPTLAPGASAGFTATFNAPVDTCSFTGTVQVSGTDACSSAPVTASTSATCPLVTTPRLVVTQDCPTSPPGLGGVLSYTGTVRNAGDVTLTNVVVTSDRTGSATVFRVTMLAPGGVENFTGSYAVPGGSACTITSTLTASANNACNGARITSTAPATCLVQGAPNLAVTLACPVGPTPLGGVLAFTGTVRNTGNITLTNVVVRRDAPGTGAIVFTAAVLNAGAAANFGGSYTVPATDACSVVTSVSATASENCGGTPVVATATLDCPLATLPRIVITQTCPTGPSGPGESVTYTASVANPGNVTLTNIVVVSSHPAPNTVVFSLATLAPGASASFDHNVLSAPDACSVSSTLSASGQGRCNGLVVQGGVTTTCPLVVAPRIAVTKNCPVTPVTEGGSLVFTGTVMNTGNVTLTDVFVYNSRPAANTRLVGPISLAPGAVTNFTASYTAPLDACSVTDTLTATGRDKCLATSVTNTVTTSCPVLTVPRIAVTLVCPATPSMTGAPITYTGFVRNAGNVTLNDVTVVHGQADPGVVLRRASLAPGESAGFSATFLSPSDACAVSGTVVATGSDACTAVSVSANASATCPLLTAPKLVVTQDCPAIPPVLGGILTYNGSVRNTGNITLTNVTVTNDRSGAVPVFSVASLAPGAIAAFTASFPVPANAGCSLTSTLLGAGFEPCSGTRVTASTSATCPLATVPGIRVTQACPVTSLEPGSLLKYTGSVVNTGNVTLTNVVVVSSRPSAGTVVFTAPTLAPGATATFSGTYQVPLDCCITTSTVRASAAPICPGPAVTDSFTATCTVTGTAKIVVTKVCPSLPVKPGERMEFKGTVSNAGNITLIDVTVVNNLMGPTPLLGPVALAPGESLHYSGEYIMPADFCGPDTVTARGLNVCTYAEVTDAALVPCAIVTTPRLAVTKHCPTQPVLKGELFTFTGTVANTGDVTLRDVFVVNSKPAPGTEVIGPITLAPGESRDFSGSYRAAPCCCETVDTLTARGQSRCTTESVTATSTVVCPLVSSPRLAIQVTCPTSPVSVGGTFQYSGTISNGGDVVLTNVLVSATQPSGSGPVFGPIELGAGETKAFSGSFTVLAGLDPSNNTVTVRGQEICDGRFVSASADCFGPVDPTVRITAVRLQAGNVSVSWSSIPGSIYVLQSKPDRDAGWTDVEGEVVATGVSASKFQPVNHLTHLLYRVKLVQE